jgi:hypothetical protein
VVSAAYHYDRILGFIDIEIYTFYENSKYLGIATLVNVREIFSKCHAMKIYGGVAV